MTKVTSIAAILGLGLTSGAWADDVINDDLIVIGNLCVGSDCVENEPLGAGIFDSYLKMKGEVIGLEFSDTSTGAGLPTRDWRIKINDAGAMGRTGIIFEDQGTLNEPFIVWGGAPSSSLFVASDGDIGLGTSLPQGSLHIVETSQTSLRMESVSPAQSWDIGSSSAGFSISDISASTVPMLVEAGAPTDALVLTEDGDLGLGLPAPGAPLHIQRATGFATDMMRLENNEGVVFRLIDTAPDGQEWTFQSNNGLFRVASPAIPGPELTMDDNGNLTIRGELTTAGSCSVGCDRVFDPDYDLPSIEEHHAKMWEYGYLPNVGPTDENGPFNVSDKMGRMLNELEHAHIFIARQQAQIAELEAQYSAQIDDLTARLTALERNP